MNLQQAQLGSSPGINLGGYIPAAQRNPKLWQAALAQMLGSVGSEVLGGVVGNALTPNLTETAKAQGVTIDESKFWQKKQATSDIAALSGQNTNRKNTDASIAATARGGDQKDAELDLQRAEHLRKTANDKDAAVATNRGLDNDAGRLEVAKQGLSLAKTKQEQDFYIQQIQAYSGLKDTASQITARGTQAGATKAATNRAEAAAPGERALTEAQTKNQSSQARYHEAAAGGGPTTGGGGMLAEDRAIALKDLGLESLSPEKQQAAQQAALMVPMTTDRVAYRNAVRQAAAAAAAN